MPLKKPNDIATFYTEVAEVSLTNSLLYIRLLADELDDNVLERHRRKLREKLPSQGFYLLIDLEHSELSFTDKIMLLLPSVKKCKKVAVLTKKGFEMAGGSNIMKFSSLNQALGWLKS
ncbi:MAG: hypothetical protein ACRC3B_15350 [Bacteroidia bacterium]